MNTSQKFIFSIENDETIRSRFTDEQITLLKEKAKQNQPPIWDKKIFMSVIYIVGGALLLSIIIAAFSIFPQEYIETMDPISKELKTKKLIEKDVNIFFVMIASASIGALAGLLTPTPSEN